MKSDPMLFTTGMGDGEYVLSGVYTRQFSVTINLEQFIVSINRNDKLDRVTALSCTTCTVLNDNLAILKYAFPKN